ncbi:MAG: polysaccharide deacetylase family protein [Rhodoferax sp.]|nr:polysaccharide deacetylase family protein [Rhodoferax sp.]
MKRELRIAALRTLRALGVFAAARLLTRNEARVLCYHGFSYQDEHAFAPQLFMLPSTFQQRLDQIAAYGFNVVPLQELTRRLQAKEPLTNVLAFTVDDGWTGFARFALPELQKRNWPVTLYLTTYYATKGRPVLNVLRRYLSWKGVSLPVPAKDDQQEHDGLLHAASAAGVDLKCSDGGLFELSSPDAVAKLCANGLDLQLHTHRHRLPAEDALLTDEIDTNRRIIEGLSGRPANHLCYPSGEYRRSQFPLLKKLGVQSATTTHLELVNHRCDSLELPRLLDGENLHPVELDAELSGFSSLVRRIRRRG